MKKRLVATAVGAWGAALLLFVAGAGFTLRQVIVAGMAVSICIFGADAWKEAFSRGPFHRFQFRIELDRMGQAFLDAGIYTPRDLPSMDDIRNSMTGKGRIVFTWLESGLVYLNTHNGFDSEPKFSIYLQTFRNGIEVSNRRGDELEMRKTATGYELVLIASETIGARPRPYQYPGTVLFHLPHSLFSALQGRDSYYRRFERARAIMEGVPGIKFREIEEVQDGWDFENEYGTFRWWPL